MMSEVAEGLWDIPQLCRNIVYKSLPPKKFNPTIIVFNRHDEMAQMMVEGRAKLVKVETRHGA